MNGCNHAHISGAEVGDLLIPGKSKSFRDNHGPWDMSQLIAHIYFFDGPYQYALINSLLYIANFT